MAQNPPEPHGVDLAGEPSEKWVGSCRRKTRPSPRKDGTAEAQCLGPKSKARPETPLWLGFVLKKDSVPFTKLNAEGPLSPKAVCRQSSCKLH